MDSQNLLQGQIAGFNREIATVRKLLKRVETQQRFVLYLLTRHTAGEITPAPYGPKENGDALELYDQAGEEYIASLIGGSN